MEVKNNEGSDLLKALKLPYGIASFNNSELYHIISGLLVYRESGKKMVDKERLFICTENDHYVKFFFIKTTPEALTYLYVGTFHEEFDEIEIYQSPAITSDIFSAEINYFEPFMVSKLLDIRRGDGIQMHIKPVTLIEGLLKLSRNPNVKVREMNPLFNVMSDDKIEDGFRRKYEFYAGYDPQTGNYKDFNGTYYLIAEPGNHTVNIYDYILIENDNKNLPGQVKFSKKKLTSKHGKDFLVGRYSQ